MHRNSYWCVIHTRSCGLFFIRDAFLYTSTHIAEDLLKKKVRINLTQHIIVRRLTHHITSRRLKIDASYYSDKIEDWHSILQQCEDWRLMHHITARRLKIDTAYYSSAKIEDWCIILQCEDWRLMHHITARRLTQHITARRLMHHITARKDKQYYNIKYNIKKYTIVWFWLHRMKQISL